MMSERYTAWCKNAATVHGKTGNAVYPAHILFYRDGVSESQCGMVLHEEKAQIEEGCLAAYREYSKNPNGVLPTTLTLIVVTKRHHARFFPLKDTTPNFPNLPAGTTVDTLVVAPKFTNFYLQSHDSPLGSARSSHYIVLYDNLKVDGVESPFTTQELESIVSYRIPSRLIKHSDLTVL